MLIKKNEIHYWQLQKLDYKQGAFITTAKVNQFRIGKNEGSCLRNLLENDISGDVGCTYCNPNQNIIIQLLTPSLINTIKIRMYRNDLRDYQFKVFIKTKGNEIMISQITQSKGKLIKLKFKDVFVNQIRFYNVNGNNENNLLSIVKVIATYQF